jgi:hypothetical protein
MHLLDTDTLAYLHAGHPRAVGHLHELDDPDVGTTSSPRSKYCGGVLSPSLVCRAQHVEEDYMATTVGQMTTDELREMIGALIEQKLLELLGDPDEGLEIRKAVRDRLLRQKKAVAGGERGEPLEEVTRRLGLV